MKALVAVDTIVQLSTDTFPVADPFFWADVSDTAQVGDHYTSGAVTPPTPTDTGTPTPPEPTAWLERLAPEKQIAIAERGLINAQAFLWLLKAAGRSSINVNDPNVASAIESFFMPPLDLIDLALLQEP